ncbi:monocarboxylate transporter 11-like isoform X2 [Asterias rubens]|nr:monocarboxylate transporter 11-like isoform X2 [Asterias rubens]
MMHSCFERILQAVVDTFQDGGFHGWVAVLCLFVTRAARATLFKGLGMMLPTLQEQFSTSTWLIGWMVATTEVGAQVGGFFATPLKERFGARTVVIVCGLTAGISMITASLISSYVIAIILTFLTGPAIGIPYVIMQHLIGCHFNKSITTAFGVAVMGSSLSYVAVVPLIQLFLDIYGWRGTMLLLGGLFLHLAVCGALIKSPAASGGQDDYEAARINEEKEARDDTDVPNKRFGCSCFTAVCSFARGTIQSEIYSSMSFWIITFHSCVWPLMYSAWIIYYVQYSTVYKEITLEATSHFIVAFGIGRAVACVLIGPVVQKTQVVGTYTWYGIALLLPAICYAVDPWLTSFWLIAANAFVLGIAISMST